MLCCPHRATAGTVTVPLSHGRRLSEKFVLKAASPSPFPSAFPNMWHTPETAGEGLAVGGLLVRPPPGRGSSETFGDIKAARETGRHGSLVSAELEDIWESVSNRKPHNPQSIA